MRKKRTKFLKTLTGKPERLEKREYEEAQVGVVTYLKMSNEGELEKFEHPRYQYTLKSDSNRAKYQKAKKQYKKGN